MKAMLYNSGSGIYGRERIWQRRMFCVKNVHRQTSLSNHALRLPPKKGELPILNRSPRHVCVRMAIYTCMWIIQVTFFGISLVLVLGKMNDFFGGVKHTNKNHWETCMEKRKIASRKNMSCSICRVL